MTCRAPLSRYPKTTGRSGRLIGRCSNLWPVRYGVDIPNFGRWADPREVARFAADLEDAGWDGLAIWDHILVEDGLDVGDPWIALAAAASVTERLILMTMVTPLPRRAPWKLAREVVPLDQLSNGRFVLGVGIGWPNDPEFTRFDGPLDLFVQQRFENDVDRLPWNG